MAEVKCIYCCYEYQRKIAGEIREEEWDIQSFQKVCISSTNKRSSKGVTV